jgi:hypothetical protein
MIKPISNEPDDEIFMSNEITEEAKQWCMVYDNRTGEIIHTQEYVPVSSNDLLSKQDLEKLAIRNVSPNKRYDLDSISAFHPRQADIDLMINKVDLDPMIQHKINLETHSLVAEPIDFDIKTSV